MRVNAVVVALILLPNVTLACLLDENCPHDDNDLIHYFSEHGETRPSLYSALRGHSANPGFERKDIWSAHAEYKKQCNAQVQRECRKRRKEAGEESARQIARLNEQHEEDQKALVAAMEQCRALSAKCEFLSRQLCETSLELDQARAELQQLRNEPALPAHAQAAADIDYPDDDVFDLAFNQPLSPSDLVLF